MCCNQKNNKKQEGDRCAKIEEMMKNYCPDQKDVNTDFSAMRNMMARNCCPAQRKNKEERPCC